jgi:hypothetical protein
MSEPVYAPRSFADPLSNLVVLSALDIRRHIRQIYHKDLPPSCLPTFLHEATHHWCFSSPVGFAELLLFFRARREAFRYRTTGRASRDRQWDVLDAVIRYEFAQGLMRPLSEGIALFAEHDVSIGRTATVSVPLQLASALFARGLAVLEGTELRALPLVLAAGRLTPAHIRRKADLLMQPFSAADGGYLPGYLAVKNLWMLNLMHLVCPIFLDTDFFLQFLRSYFYSDWAMVARLLDPTPGDVGALGPIADHLQRRLHAFATGQGREEAALKYEKDALSGGQTLELKATGGSFSFAYDEVPDGNEEASRIGKVRLQDLFGDLFNVTPSTEDEQALVELDLLTLKLWSTITLGHADLQASASDKNLEFLHADAPIFRIRRPEGIQPGWSGRMGVEVVADTWPTGLYLFLTNDDGLVETRSLGIGDVPAKLTETFMHADSRQAVVERSRQLLQETLDDPSIGIAATHARNELKRLVDPIYLPRALFVPSDDQFSSISRAMSLEGLLPLLGGSLDLLSDAAAASLLIPLNHVPQSVSAFRKWTDADPDAAIARVNSELSRQFGFQVFPTIDSLGIKLAFI